MKFLKRALSYVYASIITALPNTPKREERCERPNPLYEGDSIRGLRFNSSGAYGGQISLPECEFHNTEEDMAKVYDENCRKRGLERNKKINDLLRKCVKMPVKGEWFFPEK